MRITQEADYALRIVYHLAKTGVVVDAKTISDNTNVPLRFSLKILRKLLVGNIVASQKGVGGGYRFSAEPEKVTMRRVIELIDGPFAINKCISEGHVCSCNGDAVGECFFHQVFRKVNDMVSEKLDKVTIAMVTSEDISPEEILKNF